MALRKRGKWIMASAVAVAGLPCFLTWRALNENPFAFLHQFQPKVYEVDYTMIYTPPVDNAVRSRSPRTTIYVVDPRKAAQTLDALERELTEERGYVLSRGTMREDMYGLMRVFTAGQVKGEEFANWSATYCTGDLARSILAMYKTGPRPDPGQPACVVMVTHRRSWVESQWVRLMGG